MVSKNDLSSVKVKDEKTLKDIEQVHEIAVSKARPGRKKKSPEEKESELVPLKLLPSEYRALVKKAGMVKVATYLKHMLRTETDWLKEDR